MRKLVGKLCVIDGLANRKHDCDLLLDQACRKFNAYENLVNVGAKLLLGSQYIMLKPEFICARKNVQIG
jgi:UDP-2,4-diacetamido-2,4,6-trideoxy-beta-L-altropyranose hydrolase